MVNDEPEVLIALVLENLGKQLYIMLLLNVSLDCLDDRVDPLHDQRLQSILLVEVSIHELFQCLSAKFVVCTLLVKFDFLGIHVCNQVCQLLLSEHSTSHLANGCIVYLLSLVRLVALGIGGYLDSLAFGEAGVLVQSRSCLVQFLPQTSVLIF